jgi:hypothetical protein
MIRKVFQGALALALVAALATPPARAVTTSPPPSGFFDALWSWVVSIWGEPEPDEGYSTDPNGGAATADAGYGIDPDGAAATADQGLEIDPDG